MSEEIAVSRGKKLTIALHILVWSIVLGIPAYFMRRYDVDRNFVLLYYVSTTINGLIFYGNYLVLVPRFFFIPGRRKYFVFAGLLLIAFYFVSDFSNRLIFHDVIGRNESSVIRPHDLPGEGSPDKNAKPMPPGPRLGRVPYKQMHTYNFAFNALFLIFIGIGLRVLERNASIEKRQKELEKEKLNSELAFLKNQISPHFFFNTLNNIYSLISINAHDSQEAVLKLSKLMRYLLYESEHGATLLSSEIEFMNHYIDLMRLRMTDKVELQVSFPGKYENHSIPPLLFISFIENAFKHGISYREKSFIHIGLSIEKDGLTFRCSNSLFRSAEKEHPEHSGIGLDNVRKRLALLYPGKHRLDVRTSAAVYEVELQIDLTKA
jgi:two-component system, LytTR family, sensor kinase